MVGVCLASVFATDAPGWDALLDMHPKQKTVRPLCLWGCPRMRLQQVAAPLQSTCCYEHQALGPIFDPARKPWAPTIIPHVSTDESAHATCASAKPTTRLLMYAWCGRARMDKRILHIRITYVQATTDKQKHNYIYVLRAYKQRPTNKHIITYTYYVRTSNDRQTETELHVQT